MIDEYSLRSCCEHELEQIERLEKECFSQPWSLNALTEFYKNPNSDIFVSVLREKVVGYVTFTKILDEIQIANVAVDKAFRRCGIAGRLIDEIINFGQKNDFSVITLEARQSNLAAVTLYTKKGFEIVGKINNYYSFPKEAAILMNFTIHS